jgi:hypothetical protein
LDQCSSHCSVGSEGQLQLFWFDDFAFFFNLVQVKNKIPPEKKKGVVYEVQCHDCDDVYVGETGRTLKKRISEHKQAMKRGDQKNGIAVHVMTRAIPSTGKKPMSDPLRQATGEEECKKPSESRDNPTR